MACVAPQPLARTRRVPEGTIDEAQTKVGLLMNEDPSGRVYKVVQKNDDGSFSDIS
jgi:hypothetical protein